MAGTSGGDQTAWSMNEFLTNELTAAKVRLVSAEGRVGYFQQQVIKEREESEQTIYRLKEQSKRLSASMKAPWKVSTLKRKV